MSRIDNKYLQSFIDIISEENRVFSVLNDNDKTFCKRLFENYSEVQKISSGEDIFSFHYIYLLDELIINKLKCNNSLCIDEFECKLSVDYYKLLKDYSNTLAENNIKEPDKPANPSNDTQPSNQTGTTKPSEYSDISMTEETFDLDNIPWVLETLKYIDIKCEMLSHASSLTNVYTDDAVSQNLKNLNEVNKKITDVNGYIDEIANNSAQKITEIEKQYNTLDNQIKLQKKSYKKQNEKLKHQEQKATENYITILGIFVAIVTVLIAGVSFTGLVTKELLMANPIKSLMFIGMISIILYDALLSLFYYLSKLTGKPIHNTDYCNFCCSKNSLKKLICPIAHNYKFAFWSNVILGLFMLFLFNLYLLTNNHINIGFTSNGISFMNVFISMSIPVLIIILLLIFTRPCQEHIDELNSSKQSSKIHVKKSEKSNKNEQ
jgi:hypothetical protein